MNRKALWTTLALGGALTVGALAGGFETYYSVKDSFYNAGRNEEKHDMSKIFYRRAVKLESESSKPENYGNEYIRALDAELAAHYRTCASIINDDIKQALENVENSLCRCPVEHEYRIPMPGIPHDQSIEQASLK
jgi:hypothetical protein